MTHRFELQHTLSGERSEVFRAWLDPDRLLAWFRPSEAFRTVAAEVDARPGGRYAIRLDALDGSPVRVHGRYRTIEADRRLAFSHSVHWGAETPEEPPEPAVVTVELAEAEGATRLTLTEEGVANEELAAQLKAGWYGCLARLAGALDASLEVFFERVTRFPRCRSRFGGFWPDYTDVEARIEGRRELGLLNDTDAALFRHWSEKGFVVLPGACAPADVDRFLAEVDRAWEEETPGVGIEYFHDGERSFGNLDRHRRSVPHKVLDIHGHSQAARDLVFAPPIRRFLEQLFERPAMAFQSLLFDVGTEQDMHQDTAYVLVSSPMEFVGCWIALEDVQPGTGELQYYEGSHRIEEYLWMERARAKPYDYLDDQEFLTWVRERSEAARLPLTRFRPKKGDALLWHADLVHGGGLRTDRAGTRQSLVTHLCPRDLDPEWFGTTRHSAKLRDPSGGYYCYRER